MARSQQPVGGDCPSTLHLWSPSPSAHRSPESGPGPGVPIQLPGTCEPCVLMGTSRLGGGGPARLCSLEAPMSSSASRVSEAERQCMAWAPCSHRGSHSSQGCRGGSGTTQGPGRPPSPSRADHTSSLSQDSVACSCVLSGSTCPRGSDSPSQKRSKRNI